LILVANLDCELVMARAKGQRSEVLPLSAQRTASALGTLMRAYAGNGDRLWTLLPVDGDRLPPLPGIPEVELVSGPIALDDEVLRWGETSESSATVNDRNFALRIAKERGWALPGAGMFHSIWAIEEHLAKGGADAAPGRRWVLKQPLSAAGRSRVIGEGARFSKTATSGAQRLLNAQDAILFEPWMARIEDISATGWVTDHGPTRIAAHRLKVDDAGHFRGVMIDPAYAPPEEVKESADVAGKALCEHGYRGPFGIDAFRYRDESGRVRLNPLCEINARMTFGHVAREFSRRLETPRIVLRVGKPKAVEGAGVVALLHPGEDDPTAAWLEIG
jgi:hypothetical protein